MVESISYLNIQPIYRYRGNGNGGQTTITSFDELLKDEVEQVAAGSVKTEQVQETVHNVTVPETSPETAAHVADTSSDTTERTEILGR